MNPIQPHHNSRRRGASLIEVVIATGVVALVMTAILSVVSVSLRNTVHSKNKLLATKYTQEGLEYFRAQRNILGWEYFVEILGAGGTVYCLNTLPYTETGGLEQLPARDCLPNEFVGDHPANFQRKAEVSSTVAGGQTTFVVTIVVSWIDGNQPVSSRATLEVHSNVYSEQDLPQEIIIASPIPPGPSPSLPPPSPGTSPQPSPIPSPGPPIFELPSGAVVALDLESCPAGWSPFSSTNGRVIIGTNPVAGGGLSVRTRGHQAGTESHVLTVDQLPAHTHMQSIWGSEGGSGWGTLGYFGGQGSVATSQRTVAAGDGEAHNNMMPFTVLLYCRKD